MRLVNYKHNLNVKFDENTVNTIVIENKHTMSNIIFELIKQMEGEDGEFVLSTENKILDINKYLDIVIDPFNINFNSKKIINSLYHELNETALVLDEEKRKINEAIICSLDRIIFNEIYTGINHNLDFQWSDIFKLYNVSFSLEHISLLEKLIEYIKIQSTFLKTKVLVFINLKSYLTTNDLIELYRQAAYNKIHLLLIDNCESIKINNEEITLIDKDNCIIVK